MRLMCPHDGDDSLHIGELVANAVVLLYTHRRVVLQCAEVRTLSQMDDKPIRWYSLHHSQPQMTTVMAMTITIDSLLPRPKYGCDGGYDVAVKGLSIVVHLIFILLFN